MEKESTYVHEPNNQKRRTRSKGNNRLSPECRWLIFAFLSVVGPVSRDFAAGRHEDNNSSPFVDVTIGLYNQAQIPAEILQGAENDVVQVFRLATANPIFVDCSTTREHGPSYLACREAPGFALKIVTIDKTKRLPASSDGFGLALACGPREVTCTAYVFYDRSRQFAPIANVGPEVVLGRVLCHELGHLLGLGHSESGLMRGEWNANDFLPRNLLGMLFTTWDCQRIRAQAVAHLLRGGRNDGHTVLVYAKRPLDGEAYAM